MSDFRGPKGSIGFGLVLVVASALSAAPAAAQSNEFGSPVAYPAGIGASCAAAADFNRDGVLDLAVVDPDTGTQGVSILLGNGDGSFQAPQTIAFHHTNDLQHHSGKHFALQPDEQLRQHPGSRGKLRRHGDLCAGDVGRFRRFINAEG